MFPCGLFKKGKKERERRLEHISMKIVVQTQRRQCQHYITNLSTVIKVLNYKQHALTKIYI